MQIGKTFYASDRKKWRSWLSKHHATEKEIWLLLYRKGVDKPSVTYDQAVEEALCYGWVDSIMKSIDQEKRAQRFSPRKKTSNLSPSNRQRIQKLINQGKMTEAGLNAVAHAFKAPKK